MVISRTVSIFVQVVYLSSFGILDTLITCRWILLGLADKRRLLLSFSLLLDRTLKFLHLLLVENLLLSEEGLIHVTLIDRLLLLHLVLSGLWLHLIHILLLARILGLMHYVILLIHLLGAIVVLLVLRHRLSMSLNLLVSFVESIDVEIREV